MTAHDIAQLLTALLIAIPAVAAYLSSHANAKKLDAAAVTATVATADTAAKLDTVHDAVNNNYSVVVDRVTQLTDALNGAGVKVPAVDPSRPVPAVIAPHEPTTPGEVIAEASGK